MSEQCDLPVGPVRPVQRRAVLHREKLMDRSIRLRRLGTGQWRPLARPIVVGGDTADERDQRVSPECTRNLESDISSTPVARLR